MPTSSAGLLALNPSSGAVLVDPQLAEEPEGVYDLRIQATRRDSTQQFPLRSQVHLVRDVSKLALVLDQHPDLSGVQLPALAQELQLSLSARRAQDTRVFFSGLRGLSSVRNR